jgi:hypothetical protein
VDTDEADSISWWERDKLNTSFISSEEITSWTTKKSKNQAKNKKKCRQNRNRPRGDRRRKYNVSVWVKQLQG